MRKNIFMPLGFAFVLACGSSSVVNKTFAPVGGTVTGLVGTLVLKLNDSNNLSLTANGSFAFTNRLEQGQAFAVTVATQPPDEICTVTGGDGVMDTAQPPSIAIACEADEKSVGGTVSGLHGTLVLQNNAGDDLTITNDGAFTFALPAKAGDAYAVTILTPPRHQSCVLSSESGMVSANVSNISVSCSIQPMVDAGSAHSCAVSSAGKVRCWGSSADGQTGLGLTTSIGDDETPASAGDVDVGGVVFQVAAGGRHTCALLITGGVRCWGASTNGQLGYGNTDTIGDNELPSTLSDVSLGGKVSQIAVGTSHSCALLETGAIRCWGSGGQGRLGLGNQNNIGDDELPSSVSEIDIGGKVTQISAGGSHTCALMETGTVRCFGYGTAGTLGYGNASHIGDNEAPSSAGDVTLAGTITQVGTSDGTTCVLLTTGAVHCWGVNFSGQLGFGDTTSRNSPTTALDIGGTVKSLAMGLDHSCVLMTTGAVRCWGNSGARLGYGNANVIGDDEVASASGEVSLGSTVSYLSAGLQHTIAILADGTIRTWGNGALGRLGYANTNNIGDDELPSTVGAVSVW